MVKERQTDKDRDKERQTETGTKRDKWTEAGLETKTGTMRARDKE